MQLLVLVIFLSSNVAVVKSGLFDANSTQLLTMCAMCEDIDRYVIECGPDNHFVTVAISALTKYSDRCSNKHNCTNGTVPSCCELQQGNFCSGESENVFEMHINCLYTSRCILRLASSSETLPCKNLEVNVQLYAVGYTCVKDEVHMGMTSNKILSAPSVYLVTDSFPNLVSLREEDWVCSAEAVCGDQIELYLIEFYFMEYGLCPSEMRVEEDGEHTVVLTCNPRISANTQLIFVSKRNFVTLRLTKTSSSVREANVVFYLAFSAVNGNVSVKCGTESQTAKTIACSDDPITTTECADCKNEEETQLDMFTIILILFGTVIVIVIIAVAAIFVNQNLKRKKRRAKRIRVKPTTQTNIRTLKALPQITNSSSTTKQPLPGLRKQDPVLIDTRLRNVKSMGLSNGDFLMNDPLNPNKMAYSYAHHGQDNLTAVEGDVLE